MATASGSFEVTMTLVEQAGNDGGGEAPITVTALAKTLTGDLVGHGTGSMLAHTTEVAGSAAYVAMELLTGRLAGRHGSFVAHHTGVMEGGDGDLTIGIVPDSGTGELVGITGSMTIDVDEDGGHTYSITYELP
ncbi:MAG: DUF3224 domain-containing protein [Actinomycetota bacterium]